MRKGFSALVLLLSSSHANASDVVITGVMDGPLTGGTPKAIELYVISDVTDLSTYGVGSANNGGGSDGEEFTLSGTASAGDFLYIASDPVPFESVFGFAPQFDSSAANISGDDAVELFHDGLVVDVFGDINTDGTNEPWEYTDGWAYRASGTGAGGTVFDLNDWTFGGADVLDGLDAAATAAAVPFATFAPVTVPLPGAIWLLGGGVVVLAARCVTGRGQRRFARAGD